MDSKELLNDKIKSDDFSYSFKIERHFFTILKIKENFELKVDNLPFIEIMEDERCGKLEKMRENLQKKQKENNLKDKQPKINKVKEDEFEYDDGDKKFENNNEFEYEKDNNKYKKVIYIVVGIVILLIIGYFVLSGIKGNDFNDNNVTYVIRR